MKAASKTVQRVGASRFAQRQIQRHRRLAPVADLVVGEMRRRLKVVAVGVAVVVAVLIAAHFYRTRPLTEQEVFAAERLDFVSEIPIPDGGSYVFTFRLGVSSFPGLGLVIPITKSGYIPSTAFTQELLRHRLAGRRF